ncbi:MAG: maleylpyruvate isomerase N-terminal domain-containing protein [Thermomicrobiales bacterium]
MADDWDDLRERFAIVSADFLALASQIHAARAEEPGVCGDWSVKEIVAHMAAWDWEGERHFRELHSGTAENQSYDINAFNASAVEERRGQTWEETLDELRRANMTFAASLATVSAADRQANAHYASWLRAIVGHYEEHTAQVRALLAA